MHRIVSILLILSVSGVTMGQTTYMLYGYVADIITRAPIDSAWVVRMDTAQNVIDSVQSVKKNMN